MNNYIHYKVWDEITYLFPNFNGATVEVWEWISDFIPDFNVYVITYPSCDLKLNHVSKGATEVKILQSSTTMCLFFHVSSETWKPT